MASDLPPFVPGTLDRGVQRTSALPGGVTYAPSDFKKAKFAGGAASPGGAAAAARRVGLPRVTAPPGPSIAAQAKPIGFGRKLPGALKGSI